MSKILVSGVKPTGRPHIGNYFGAMRQFVDLQDKYESHIFVANLHALTSLQNGSELKDLSRDVVLDYLAIGIDPTRTTLYLQSDVPHVTELAWIFSCLTTMPELMRSHAFKDAEAKNKDINVGTFNYPLLMAADILAVDGEMVPVGKDQIQHIEIAREVARDFNNTYGETFAEPKELVYEGVATFIGIDGQKMSKSYNNTIPLFASDEEIEDKVMQIKTGEAGTTPPILYEIHQQINMAIDGDPTGFDNLYKENKNNFKKIKEVLIEDMKKLIGPMRERRTEWAAKTAEVDEIIARGGEKMRQIVHDKMVEVREKVGLIHHE